MALYGFDAFSPAQIAGKVEAIGVSKARLPLWQMIPLGVLAGAFIALGAMYYVLVVSDASLGFAASRVLGGVVFSLGLLLVVVAGAELFTGNNLLAMAWADGRISSRELLQNWLVVCAANFAGAAGMALLIWRSGHAAMNDGRVAVLVVQLAGAKCAAPLAALFWKGVLCNILVCMAVWMALAGRSVTDKFIAIVFPISAFVAAGFEHSIANMYLIPLALLLRDSVPPELVSPALNAGGMLRNLAAVIAGNLLGGSVLVALVYHLIYRRSRADIPPQ